jgi:hypothetical protein
MAIGSPEDFGDQPGEFFDGHMLGESMVIDPVRAILSMLADGRIF